MKYVYIIAITGGLFINPHILTKGSFMEKEKDIPFTEDLMREHGILNRVLLIYEEFIRRIDAAESFEQSALTRALEIIKIFIEAYHEKLEEDYVFPIFEKHKIETKLVKNLRIQHNRGREITTQLIDLNSKKLDINALKKAKQLLKKFIRMYRPHEAREDTILFPKVRLLISEAEFNKLSELFEDTEHQLFGPDGFNMILKKVEAIEKELNIFRLELFTPLI